MDYKELIPFLGIELGIYVDSDQPIKGLDVFLPFLTKIYEEGSVVLIKFDGERHGKYGCTVLISSGRLGSNFFRKDSKLIEDCVAYVIIEYAVSQWNFVIP